MSQPVYHHVLSDYTGWLFRPPVMMPESPEVAAQMLAKMQTAFPRGQMVPTGGQPPCVISPDGVSHVDTAEFQTMMAIFSKGAP
jgi:hypothetical protein